MKALLGKCPLLCKRSLTRVQRSFSSRGSIAQSSSTETVCELSASNLRWGPGATAEVGSDLRDVLSAKRVVVFTDKNLRKLPSLQVLLESLERHNVSYVIYDDVRVEPNDVSFQHAIDFLSSMKEKEGGYDAICAFGGGSVMDTAKAANLYATFPPSEGFYSYVNPPVGLGLPIPGASEGYLPALIAIPTTAGTGSETTGVAIFDDSPTNSKTGIAHRRLKPTLGVVDPINTLSMPKEVVCYSGLDVMCHAIESYTALPFHKREKPSSPLFRPAYQGSNPISDVWSLFALETAAKYLARAVENPQDEEARAKMLLASSSAGMGFGNAGVQLPHGMSYPVASQIQRYTPPSGYYDGNSKDGALQVVDHPMVPHGLSVIINAPAVFRFNGITDPGRHKLCAQILAKARLAPDRDVSDADAGGWLADEILVLCHGLGVPMGLRALGYSEKKIPSLVKGTLPQRRVLSVAPRPVGQAELEALFLDAMDV